MTENLCIPLTHLAVIKIEGNDADDFLHGQFISDLKNLEQDYFQFSAWCNPKGRVLANFILYKRDNCFYMILSNSLKETICKRLQMFVLHADVKINSMTDDSSIAGIIIHDAESLSSSLPRDENAIKTSDSITTLNIGSDRFLTIGDLSTFDSLQKCDEQQWQALDIEQGISWVTKDTSEEFLPQELNMDKNDGLSYDKGCFPGQEIIARLHHRGSIKQRLFKSTLSIDNSVNPGTKLVEKYSGKRLGIVINSSKDSDKTTYILAVADIESVSKNCVYLYDQNITLESID